MSTRHNAIVAEFRELAEALAGRSASYLEGFIQTAGWGALHVLEAAERGESAEQPLAEAAEQGRVVLETIDEFKDQAQRSALLKAVMASTRLLAFAAAP